MLNLTLRQSATEQADCIKVEGGSFYLDGCNVSSATGSGCIFTAETLGEVKRTKLHGCPGDGLRLVCALSLSLPLSLSLETMHD